MKYAIVVSEKDIAGMNIKENLLRLFDFEKSEDKKFGDVYSYKNNSEIYTLKSDTVYANNIDKDIEADFFIFATRHQSKERVHSLSCHSPGNWNKAEYGGQEKKLCIAPALMLKKAYLELKKFKEVVSTYEITLECTHHGPYLEKPVMFIEIGSTEEHWGNKTAGEVIAKTIIKIMEDNENKKERFAFAIGGPHYCNNFNKILERTDIAIGHICPKYALKYLDEGMIKQALEKTKENVDMIILDWKGLGQEKERIRTILDKIGIKVYKTEQLI
jgi:D-aminoacyl-tRNA deacylase